MNLYRTLHLFRMRPRLLAQHAGELTPAMEHQLEQHATTCSICARELHELEETDRLLRASRPKVKGLPGEISQDLFARALAESGVLSRRKRSHWSLLAGTASVVAVCLVAVLGLRSNVPEVRSRESAAAVSGTTSAESRSTPRAELAPPSSATARVEIREAPENPTAASVPQGKGFPQPDRTPGATTSGQSAAVPRKRQQAVTRRRRRAVRSRPKAPNLVAVVRLEGAHELEWHPEKPLGKSSAESPVLAFTPSDHEVPLLGEQEVRTRIAEGDACGAELHVEIENAPETPALTVAVRQAGADTPGEARASAYWSRPSGPTLWKQALVTSKRPMAELLLVSLDDDRLWGYWKEKLE